ncbi:CopM family metallochaperone [Microvirga pudoricolor]|uniref:CopM family metallochaperone n=1 Tax=Microvirga pudoricolor TaxID=2778729 RepID=UPI001951160D|nr:DUF305 domain-containing protein [Microvirga pudoricolor]MBM6596278.1 DUF305 domain-containing protein [Microvirga pudoricolor]
MKIVALLAAATLFGWASLACAQSANPHAGHAPASPGAAQAANEAGDQARTAFEAANTRMHRDMAIAYSGNPDLDFARSMIPHHQGALDMARIELQHGKDPALRKLAQEVVAAQEKEIAFLRGWLKKHAP